MLNFETIRDGQQQDQHLLALLQRELQKYANIIMANNVPLIVYIAEQGQPWKICIPSAQLDSIIRFYHQALNHLGVRRTVDSIQMHFYHPQIRARTEHLIKTCPVCQQTKQFGRGYGHLPPRDPQVAPWQEIAVDLIGPWTIAVNGQNLVFRALTIIDTVTNYLEIVRIQNASARHVGHQFNQTWLSQYPRPEWVIFDQGSEFIGRDFQQVLELHGIKDVPTTVKNPQANAICERMHQTIGNSLRTLIHAHPPRNAEETANLVDTALNTAAYAVRTAIHGTMKASPGSIVFQRDMLLNIPIIADFELLRDRREALINDQLIRANNKRISFDYQPGQQVLLKETDPRKLDRRSKGPYLIDRVHTNGTLTIRLSPILTERVNIRRVKPFFT